MLLPGTSFVRAERIEAGFSIHTFFLAFTLNPLFPFALSLSKGASRARDIPAEERNGDEGPATRGTANLRGSFFGSDRPKVIRLKEGRLIPVE